MAASTWDYLSWASGSTESQRLRVLNKNFPGEIAMEIRSLRAKVVLVSMLTFAALASGCASLPDMNARYFLPKSELRVKVIRTVACDKQDNLFVATAVLPVVKHSADTSVASSKSVSLKNLRGLLADSDVKLEFYDDGRLKGFNATSTGQGEAILKSAISVAATTFGAFIPKQSKSDCAFVRAVGDNKPLSLTYEGPVDLGAGQSGVSQPIDADEASKYYANQLHSAIGSVCTTYVRAPAPAKPATYAGSTAGLLLAVREPGSAQLQVFAGDGGKCANRVYAGEVPVAQFGQDYELLIPKAPVFGKQGFGASFSEAGALQSVQYVTAAGAGQVLNVVGAGLDATAGPTTAEKAAAVQAEADLIAQQQRLVTCRADPANCK
jgi:hypothetical protein